MGMGGAFKCTLANKLVGKQCRNQIKNFLNVITNCLYTFIVYICLGTGTSLVFNNFLASIYPSPLTASTFH